MTVSNRILELSFTCKWLTNQLKIGCFEQVMLPLTHSSLYFWEDGGAFVILKCIYLCITHILACMHACMHACSVSASSNMQVLQSVSWQISPEALCACKSRFRSKAGKSGCICVSKYLYVYVVCMCPGSLGFGWQNEWDAEQIGVWAPLSWLINLLFNSFAVRTNMATLPGKHKGHLP